ncbi:DUF3300 domain-containing protein [Tropicimonas isoalkanivorans]|uniref:DUF3300 domain-containing protein n=1 Tax=Tropicimonas isoalkanivorans TaxID=441112 RepID=A0A1I1HMC7_9RHOB|nr:DUF3300 domain-containing protein [Tropicimonas isoalkanivorans]SFC24722.1 Protein of unknown function [Tropicimonas isoalkanivorans]
MRSKFLATLIMVLAANGAAAQEGTSLLRPVQRPDNAQDSAARIKAILEGSNSPYADQLQQVAGSTAVLPMTASELDRIVAPVALYPDPLLAQILVASTFPSDVVEADRLLTQTEYMSDAELSTALQEQTWDPSVVVLLSGFPTVLKRMAEDLDWTKTLGDAILYQEDDVLTAVQRMRAEAKTIGNLETNEAQVVEEEDEQIYIRPANPEVVYVPSYDPVTTYSTKNVPYSTGSTYGTGYNSGTTYGTGYNTGYTTGTGTGIGGLLGNPIVAGALGFGSALLVDELFNNDDDDDDDDDDGWDDYWKQRQTIDWNDRRFYPRPRYTNDGQRLSWDQERDRYYDREARRWRRDADVERARLDERRQALKWLDHQSDVREDRLKALRKREREAEQAVARQREAIQAAREEAREAESEADRLREKRRNQAERLDEREAEREREARREERQLERQREAEREARRQARAEEQAAEERRERRERRQQEADRQNKQQMQVSTEADKQRKTADDDRKKQQAASDTKKRQQTEQTAKKDDGGNKKSANKADDSQKKKANDAQKQGGKKADNNKQNSKKQQDKNQQKQASKKDDKKSGKGKRANCDDGKKGDCKKGN